MLRGIILSIVKCDIAVLLGGWLYKKIHELYGDWTVWVACILWPEKSAQVDWELYVQWLIKKKKILKASLSNWTTHGMWLELESSHTN